MKILVKFPTRGRQHFTRILHRYQETRTTDKVHFLITIDKDDEIMNSPMLDLIGLWGNQTTQVIDPIGKIGAINYGVTEFLQQNIDYDIIMLASDDMYPLKWGWDQRIIEDMEKIYPDTDGVLFYNDGHMGEKLNTMCIMGREYYKRFGYIYHPDYKALWCDNEFMEVAESLGKQTYSPDVLFEHRHPVWINPRNQDYLNARDSRYFLIDKQTYDQRKQRNFDLIKHSDSNDNQPKGEVQPAIDGVKPANKRGRPRRQGAGL